MQLGPLVIPVVHSAPDGENTVDVQFAVLPLPEGALTVELADVPGQIPVDVTSPLNVAIRNTLDRDLLVRAHMDVAETNPGGNTIMWAIEQLAACSVSDEQTECELYAHAESLLGPGVGLSASETGAGLLHVGAGIGETSYAEEVKQLYFTPNIHVDVAAPSGQTPGQPVVYLATLENLGDEPVSGLTFSLIAGEGGAAEDIVPLQASGINCNSDDERVECVLEELRPHEKVSTAASTIWDMSALATDTWRVAWTFDSESLTLFEDQSVVEIVEAPSLAVAALPLTLNPTLNTLAGETRHVYFEYDVASSTDEPEVFLTIELSPKTDANYMQVFTDFDDTCERLLNTVNCQMHDVVAGVSRGIGLELRLIDYGFMGSHVKAETDDGHVATDAAGTQIQALSVVQEIGVLSATVGTKVSVELSVTNVGTLDASGVSTGTVLDGITFPSEVTFETADPRCTLEPESIVCAFGTLAAGQTDRASFVVVPVNEGESYAYTVAVSDDGRGTDAAKEFTVNGLEGIAVQIGNLLTGSPKSGEAVDIYLDDVRIVDDLGYGNASAYKAVTLSRTAPVVDVVSSDAADNTAPLYTEPVNLLGTPDDSLAISEETVVLLADSPVGGPVLIARKQARQTAMDPATVDVFFLNAATEVSAVDIDLAGTGQRVSGLAFGASSEYMSLSPSAYYVDISTSGAADHLAHIGFDLAGKEGQAVAIAITGRVADESLALSV